MGNLTRWSIRHFAILGTIFVLLTTLYSNYTASAQEIPESWYEVRSIRMDEHGLSSLQGFAFLPIADTFLVWGENGQVIGISMHEDHIDTTGMTIPAGDSLNIAFSDHHSSLYLLDQSRAELAELNINQNDLTNQSTAAIRRFNIHAVGLKDANGITFDPDSGDLFMLDAKSAQILVIAPSPAASGFEGNTAMHDGRVSRINIKKLGDGNWQGIAFNPFNRHLYLSNPVQNKLYELTENGQEVYVYDLSILHLADPRAMLFAPSVDTTDDPATMDLFIQDSSQIVELSLQAPTALPSGVTLLPAKLVHIIDTSNAAWYPSAPDPAGIDYWPLTNRLLIADSEVDEMSIYFTGKNVYLSTTSGNLTGTCSTMSFTNEPTGVAINPNNNHIFISTDDANDRVFEIGLGPDGTYCTADDTVTTTDVSGLYGVNDAEDVAYGNNTVFVAGGTAAEVYRIPLGPNGVLGGGDDGPMTHFDTAGWGFHDLEGIGFNADNGTLFIVSTQGSEHYLGETSTTGTFLRAYDLSLMGTQGNIRSDVAYAPSSQNPAVKSIYIASRGIDNDSNRKENDGKVWEIRISGSSPPPTVDTPPTVVSVIRMDSDPTSASSVNFAVTFSESVTGVDPSDFTFTTSGGISGASVSTISGTSSQFTVTVNTGSGDGTIRLNVVDNDSIIDSVGNPLGGIGGGNGNFNTGESYTVSKSITFADVPSPHPFWRYIEAFYKAGITSGCSQTPKLFCPDNPVTRGEMAVFIERALGNFAPNPSPTGMFADVPYPGMEAFTPFIEQFYNDGITAGCLQNPLRYCPQNSVKRGEMAVFIERAIGHSSPTPSPTGMFADVPYPGMETFTPFIEQFYNDGITGGCLQNPLRYCPQNLVTRGEMAVFIVRAFDIPLP